MNIRRLKHDPSLIYRLVAFLLPFSYRCSRTRRFRSSATAAPAPSRPSTSPPSWSPLAPAIAPGGTLQAGLVFTLEEHWHVYWINAGDSGEPPKITWTLPDRHHRRRPCSFPSPAACRSARSWTSATKTQSRSPSSSPPLAPAQARPHPSRRHRQLARLPRGLHPRQSPPRPQPHRLDPTPRLPRNPSAPSAKPSTSSPDPSTAMQSSPSPAARPTSSSPSSPASRNQRRVLPLRPGADRQRRPADVEIALQRCPPPRPRSEDLKTLPATTPRPLQAHRRRSLRRHRTRRRRRSPG